MATLQGLACCALLYALLAAPVAGYALGRYGSGEMAWFTAASFWLMSMWITQLLMLVCLDESAEGSAWTSGPGRTILGLFVVQVGTAGAACLVWEGLNKSTDVGEPGARARAARKPALKCPPRPAPQRARVPFISQPAICPDSTAPQLVINQASHRLSIGLPIMENLVGLSAFVLLAGACLWRRVRVVQAVWAEALLAPKGAKIRCAWVCAQQEGGGVPGRPPVVRAINCC